MIELSKLNDILDSICPLYLSEDFIKCGAYDNSGVIVNTHDKIHKIAFSLDMDKSSLDYALSNSCDTLITHHPAIYKGISSLSVDNPVESNLITSVKNDLNVLSMHLNLDIAKGGIDDCLAEKLGGKEIKTVNIISGDFGYGKEFLIEETSFEKYVETVSDKLKAKKVLSYGKGKVKKVVSFCGAGGEEALKYSGDADTVVTSDISHHEIRDLMDKGKKVIILTHYAAEIIGFYEFYKNVKKRLSGKAECLFFDRKELR